MKSTLIFLIAVLSIGFAGCSDSPTNTSGSRVRLAATVTASYCPFWSPDLGPYTLLTGKKAKVTLVRDDGLTYLAVTDDSSRIRLSVDTGTYTATIETYHQPPTPSLFPIRILQDTGGVRLGTSLTYNPPDSLNARFAYGAGDRVWSEAEERQSLTYLNDQLGKVLVFGDRQRSLIVYQDTTYITYEQIGVQEPEPAWKAERASQVIVSRHPERFSPRFALFGYFRVCLDMTGAPHQLQGIVNR
jgi:hypothetical protein